jgi:hypothetical protein
MLQVSAAWIRFERCQGCDIKITGNKKPLHFTPEGAAVCSRSASKGFSTLLPEAKALLKEHQELMKQFD